MCIRACTGTDTPLSSACWDTPPKQTPPGQTNPPVQTPLYRHPLGRHPPSPQRPLQQTVRILLECILVRYFINEESKLSLNLRNSTRLKILQVLTSAAMFPQETMHIIYNYPDSISKVYVARGLCGFNIGLHGNLALG